MKTITENVPKCSTMARTLVGSTSGRLRGPRKLKIRTWMAENAQNSSGKHVRSSTSPKSLEKACSSFEPQQDYLKNITIMLEVSSVVLRLRHLWRDIAISVGEWAISAGRASKTLKSLKTTFRKSIETARDRWKTYECSCYSYSNGSTFIMEKHRNHPFPSASIGKTKFTKNR